MCFKYEIKFKLNPKQNSLTCRNLIMHKRYEKTKKNIGYMQRNPFGKKNSPKKRPRLNFSIK